MSCSSTSFKALFQSENGYQLSEITIDCGILKKQQAEEIFKALPKEYLGKNIQIKSYDSDSKKCIILENGKEITLSLNQKNEIHLVPELAVLESKGARGIDLFWETVSSYGWYNVLQVLPPIWLIDIVYLIYCCFAKASDFIDPEDKQLIQELLVKQNPDGFYGIDSILKLTQDVLEDQGKKPEKMIQTIANAIALNESYRQSGELSSFLEQYLTLLEQSNVNEPLFFMTGYYQGLKFFDSALTAYKRDDGKYVLNITQMQATSDINSKILPDSQYILDSKEQIAIIFKMIHNLKDPRESDSLFTQEDKKYLDKANLISKKMEDSFEDQIKKDFPKVHDLIQMSSTVSDFQEGAENQSTQESEISSIYDNLWHSLILNSGGKVDTQFVAKIRKSPHLDPFKTLNYWLENNAKDGEIPSKDVIALHVMQKLLKSALVNFDRIDKQDQKKVIENLKFRFDKFSRRFAKKRTSPALTALFAEINVYISTIEAKALKQSAEIEEKVLIKKVLDKSNQSKITFKEKPSKIFQDSIQGSPIQETNFNLKKIQQLQTTIFYFQENINRLTSAEIINKLEEIVKGIHELIDLQEYSKSIELINQVYQCLPDYDSSIYPAMNYGELDNLSKNITDLSLYLLECKTRTELGVLWTTEFLNIHHAHAIIRTIRRIKIDQSITILNLDQPGVEFDEAPIKLHLRNCIQETCYEISQIQSGKIGATSHKLAKAFISQYGIESVLKFNEQELREEVQKFTKDVFLTLFMFKSRDEFDRFRFKEELSKRIYHLSGLTPSLDVKAKKLLAYPWYSPYHANINFGIFSQNFKLFNIRIHQEEYNLQPYDLGLGEGQVSNINLTIPKKVKLGNFELDTKIGGTRTLFVNHYTQNDVVYLKLLFAASLFMDESEIFWKKESYLKEFKPRCNDPLDPDNKTPIESLSELNINDLVNNGTFSKAKFELFQQMSRKDAASATYYTLSNSIIDIRRIIIINEILIDPLNALGLKEGFSGLMNEVIKNEIADLKFRIQGITGGQLKRSNFSAQKYLSVAHSIEQEKKELLKLYQQAFNNLKGRFELSTNYMINMSALPVQGDDINVFEKKAENPSENKIKWLLISLVSFTQKNSKKVKEASFNFKSSLPLLPKCNFETNIENIGSYPQPIRDLSNEMFKEKRGSDDKALIDFDNRDIKSDFEGRINPFDRSTIYEALTYQGFRVSPDLDNSLPFIGDLGSYLFALTEAVEGIAAVDQVLLHQLALKSFGKDLHKALPIALNILFGRERLLKYKIVRERLKAVFFRQGVMIDWIQLAENPKIISDSILQLKKIQERSYRTNRLEIFCFVTDILNSIQQLKLTDPSCAKKLKSIEVNPPIQIKLKAKGKNLFKVLDKRIEEILIEKILDDTIVEKLDLSMSYLKIIISKLMQDSNYLANLNDLELKALVSAWVTISDTTYRELDIFNLKSEVLNFVIPRFVQTYKKRQDQLSLVLSDYFNSGCKINFEFSEDNFGLLTTQGVSRGSEDFSEFDLKSCQVTSKKLAKPQTFVLLPPEFVNSPEIKAVIDLSSQKAVCKWIGPSVFDYIYSFTTEGGRSFNLYHNRETNRAIFSILHNGKEYALKSIKVDLLKGFAYYLDQQSIWVNLQDKKDAICFIKGVSNTSSQNVYNLKFDWFGAINHIYNHDFTQEVDIAKTNEIDKSLRFAQPYDLIVFKNAKTGNLFKIQSIAHPDISFEWVGDRLKPCWKEEGWVLNLNFEEGDRLFGKSHRDFVLNLAHTSGKQEFIIFNYEGSIDSVHSLGDLKLDKKFSLINPTSFMILSISAHGKFYGQRSVFLKLAYYAYLQKDFLKAQLWIDRAENCSRDNSTAKDQEIGFLKELKEHFSGLPLSNTRSQIIWIKALLMIEKYQKRVLKGALVNQDDEKRQILIDRLVEVYNEVQAKISSNQALDSYLRKEGFSFSNEEIMALDYLKKESFLTLLNESRPKIEKIKSYRKPSIKSLNFSSLIAPFIKQYLDDFKKSIFHSDEYLSENLGEAFKIYTKNLYSNILIRKGGFLEKFIQKLSQMNKEREKSTIVVSDSGYMDFFPINLTFENICSLIQRFDKTTFSFIWKIQALADWPKKYDSFRAYIDAGHYLSKESILKDFWNVWELISIHQIKREDLETVSWTVASFKDKEINIAADTALSILLAYEAHIEAGKSVIETPLDILHVLKKINRSVNMEFIHIIRAFMTAIPILKLISIIKEEVKETQENLLEIGKIGSQPQIENSLEKHEKLFEVENFLKNLLIALRSGKITKEEYDSYFDALKNSIVKGINHPVVKKMMGRLESFKERKTILIEDESKVQKEENSFLNRDKYIIFKEYAENHLLQFITSQPEGIFKPLSKQFYPSVLINSEDTLRAIENCQITLSDYAKLQMRMHLDLSKYAESQKIKIFQMFESYLDETSEAEKETSKVLRSNEFIGIYQLIKNFNQSNIPSIELRYIDTLRKKIVQLEKEFNSRSNPSSKFTTFEVENDRNPEYYRKFFTKNEHDKTLDLLIESGSALKIAYNGSIQGDSIYQTMVIHENKRMMDGVEAFIEKLKAAKKEAFGEINFDQLEKLIEEVKERSKKLFGRLDHQLFTILKLVSDVDQEHLGISRQIEELVQLLYVTDPSRAVVHQKEILKKAILDKLYDSYERNGLTSEGIDRVITNYLIDLTEFQQLQKGLLDIYLIKDLHFKIKSSSKSVKTLHRDFIIQQKTEEIKEAIYRLNDRLNLNRQRYLFLEGDQSQIFNRSYLVFEALNEIILREDQKETIKSIFDHPHMLREIRMGLGKSTVIFPLISKIMNKQGLFPCLIVSNELFEQTRDHMGNNDYFFEFNRNSSIHQSDLMQSYVKLLETRNSGKAVVVTVSTLAAIQNKIVELHDRIQQEILEAATPDDFKKLKKLKERTSLWINQAQNYIQNIGFGFQQLLRSSMQTGIKEKAVLSDDEKIKQLEEKCEKRVLVHDLYQQLYWLQAIDEIFDQEKTRLIADEADDNYRISLEKNYSYDTPKPVLRLGFETAEAIFFTIFEHARFKDLQKLILEDQLATLKESDIKNWMYEIALILFDEKNTSNKFICDLIKVGQKFDQERFARYISGLDNTLPEFMMTQQEIESCSNCTILLEQIKKVSCFRHMMTKTFLTVASKKQQLDFGFSETDTKAKGICVVPKRAQKETLNTKFGQEGELIFYHFLTYAYQMIDYDLFASIFEDLKVLYVHESGLSTSFANQWIEELSTKRDHFFSKIDEKSSSLKELIKPFSHLDMSELTEVQKNYIVLTQPENAVLRMKLLRYFMTGEEAKIKIFKKQIVRNVQDTADGRLVAGASGTVNSYSLLSDFEMDEKQQAKIVSAESLIQVLSSDPLKGDVKVTTFNRLFEDIRSTIYGNEREKCKAIIIQGCSLGTENAYTMIQALRREDKHPREFIFIHPEERKPYIWRIDKEVPEEFNKAVDYPTLDLANSLFFFAPADIRGTDFIIPDGFGKLYLGPTTTQDEMEQAAWRLRRLGKGQTIKVAIEKRFADILRTDATLNDVLSYIKLKTLKQNSFLNIKKLTQRPQAIVKRLLKKAIIKTIRDQTTQQIVEDRFSFKEPKIFDRLFEQSQIFSAFEKVFIQVKDFEDGLYLDYQPSREIDIESYIHEIFDQKIKHFAISKQDSSEIAKLKNEILQALEDEKDKILKNICEHRKFLPSKVPVTFFADQGAQEEVEAEEETELQSELNQELQIDVEQDQETNFNLMDGVALRKIPIYRIQTFKGPSDLHLDIDHKKGLVCKTADFDAYFEEMTSVNIPTGFIRVNFFDWLYNKPKVMLCSSMDAKSPLSGCLYFRLDPNHPEPILVNEVLLEIHRWQNQIDAGKFLHSDYFRIHEEEALQTLKKDPVIHRDIALARLELGFKVFSAYQVSLIRDWASGLRPEKRLEYAVYLRKRGIGKDLLDFINPDVELFWPEIFIEGEVYPKIVAMNQEDYARFIAKTPKGLKFWDAKTKGIDQELIRYAVNKLFLKIALREEEMNFIKAFFISLSKEDQEQFTSDCFENNQQGKEEFKELMSI